MASRSAYRNAWTSSDEEEEPDGREEEGQEVGGRIARTLRSTIVCVRPDPDSPPHSPMRSPLHTVPNSNDDRSDENRRSESLLNSHRDWEKATNAAVRVSKGFESEKGHAERVYDSNRASRARRDREDEVSIGRVRDFDRDRAVQRDYPHKDRHKDREEMPRRESSKRDSSRLPEENPGRDQDVRKFGGDVKGKEKRNAGDSVRELGSHRERSWRREGGSYNQQDRGRRDRETDSYSSDDRGADSPRSKPANGRNRMSRDEDAQDTWRGKETQVEKRRETDRGRGGDRDRGEAPVPELYSIHRATVHSVRPFGLFVRMDGYRNHGLVHLSQVSDHEVTKRDDADAAKIEALSSVAGEGESVWVKVISVKTEDDGSVKVGCSLKYVSQGDGRDLDPNNLQLEKLQAKPAWQAPKKFQLEAVYNVTCTRCGGHGHLRKECYSTGEKTYELLQDGDESPTEGRSSKEVRVVSKNLPATGQSSKPPSGPAGRGRAMVQPAWMKHGVGLGVDADKGVGHRVSTGVDDVYKDEQDLPQKVTTVQEALAVIAKLKEEKHRRREERRERKHHKRAKKHSSSEGKREKHRRRHSSEDDHKSRKKRRV